MMGMYEAAAREAERLRIIVQTFAYAHPSMTMDEAVPLILEAEKKTAELEAPKMPKEQVFVPLADHSPETGAAFIDLCPSVQEPIRDGKLIIGIKEFRGLTGWGLKESKEACQFWEATRIKGLTPATSSTIPAPTWGPADIANWIDGEEAVLVFLEGRSTRPSGAKIQAIKETRALCPSYPGLKEAKDGVEHWLATRPTAAI